MNPKELAAMLDGKQYPLALGLATKNAAEENGLVIVFGASDDLMEFRGAIIEEIDCYEGGTAYLDENGLLQNKCHDEDCPYFAELKKKAITIEAVWGDNATWSYRTEIPHETFDILYEDEEDGVYCRGIVFRLEDIPKGGDFSE